MIDSDAQIAKLRDEHRVRQDRFDLSLQSHYQDLLELLLPNLDEATLEGLKQVSGITIDEKLRERMDEDKKNLTLELETLESDPLYLSREASLCPSTSELDSDLEDLQNHHQALQPMLKTCFRHPRFVELMESGYGTPKYKKRFWRLGYYVDRKAADEIVEACGAKDFAGIRSDVHSALEASAVLQDRIKTLKKRRKEIEKLCSKCSRVRKRLQEHGKIWLESARWQLRTQLDKNPEHYAHKLKEVEELVGPVSQWLVSQALCQEHGNLRAEYLVPAAHAFECSSYSRGQQLIQQYEEKVEALSRFDTSVGHGQKIDWKAFFYG